MPEMSKRYYHRQGLTNIMITRHSHVHPNLLCWLHLISLTQLTFFYVRTLHLQPKITGWIDMANPSWTISLWNTFAINSKLMLNLKMVLPYIDGMSVGDLNIVGCMLHVIFVCGLYIELVFLHLCKLFF